MSFSSNPLSQSQAIELVQEVALVEVQDATEALYANNWNVQETAAELLNISLLKQKLLAFLECRSVPCLSVKVSKLIDLKHSGLHRLKITVDDRYHLTGWIPGDRDKVADSLFEFNRFRADSRLLIEVWHRRLIRANKCVGVANWKISNLAESGDLIFSGGIQLYHKFRPLGWVKNTNIVFDFYNETVEMDKVDYSATQQASADGMVATNNSGNAGTSTVEPTLVFPAADVKHFVGGFHSDVGEENLRQYFSQFGAVSDVKIMRDSTTGRSRGFGFVTMAEPSSKQKILAEKEHTIGGRKASVRPYSEADLKDSFTDGPILKRKIFVGGVNPALGHEALENYFGKYGPLEDATIMRYPDGRSRGFGFVVFRDESTCAQVLQQRNHLVTPRDKVEVKPCLSRGKSRPAGSGGGVPDSHYGGGGAGGGGGGGGYSMAPVHPYGGGSAYGYPGTSAYGNSSYGSMYGSAGGYGGAYGPGYAVPGGAWTDYRDGSAGAPAGGAWSPYEGYGGYYSGWTGNYSGGAATMTQSPQQQAYGPGGLQRTGGMAAVSGQVQGAGSTRGADVGYYDIGPSAAASASGSGGAVSVSPITGTGLSGATASHPGYVPMRRVGGTTAMPPASAASVGGAAYGGMGRGRSGPY